MSKEWDRENRVTVGANLKKTDAEMFKSYAAEHNTTPGRLLRGFVESVVHQEKKDEEIEKPIEGYPHIVSYKNTDLLKHETAFHNPKNLNPDGVLNDILDRYFAMAKRMRASTPRE